MRTPRSGELAAKHIVILGAGFGGLYAARALRGAPARATLIDRRNHHLFQPLLYQVATAALSPSHIFFLIGFRNRFIVMFKWTYSYLTFRRGARLITGASRGIGDESARSRRSSTVEERPSGQEHRPSAA